MLLTSSKSAAASTAEYWVTNEAFATAVEPITGRPVQVAQSNSVRVLTSIIPPIIKFFTSGSFSTEALSSPLNSPLYVQTNAASCNNNSDTAETYPITLSSALTGDEESFIATETSANSGVFRILPEVPTRDGEKLPVVHGNGILEIVKNETVTATIEGCGMSTVARAVILIDPYGVVFDSRTNTPVAGAVVTLIDVDGRGNGGYPGGLAKVYLTADMSVPAPSIVTTGSDGAYQFPFVFPSTYRLTVTPPNGYAFPSTIPAGLLPSGRTIDLSGSYGGNFLVSGTVKIDIPLDRGQLSGLFIEKAASRSVVEIGDFVDYTVKVKNSTGLLLTGISLTDNLPAGFKYQRGTSRLDGNKIGDPEGGAVPKLIFNIGDLANGRTGTLTYRLKVGPGSLEGEGLNRAQANAANGATSNIAAVKVKVIGGVFSDNGYIIGKVFVDCNQNGIQDNEEPGIPGVRLFLEDGTFVITDGEGKYSLYGISPRTHVLKIDKTTMPACSQLMTLSNRFAGDPNSRFVDLKTGELHKADFAEGSCTAEILEEVRRRKTQDGAFISESESRAAEKLTLNNIVASDARSLPASGLIGDKSRIPSFQSGEIEKSRIENDDILPAGSFTASFLLADEEAAKMDNSLDFINLKDNDILPLQQTNIQVKGVFGSKFKLTVNGEEILETRVGKKGFLESNQIQIWEYIGVDLSPGLNQIEASQIDSSNNILGAKSITVKAPGKLTRIVVITPEKDQYADGRSRIPIRVELKDEQGLPVITRTPLTLEAGRGQWHVEDLDEREPGVQVFIEGEGAVFNLIAPAESGDVTVRVSSGNLSKEEKVSFIPELRPMLAVGLIEGSINFQKLDPKALVPARSQDGFEQELRNIAFTDNDGKTYGGGRAALYLKGKIAGDYLLTIAYDSDKDTKERLFRDIQPDEYYPVYGDSSIKGFDAQSTSSLYVRVDKGKAFVLYGDFTTGAVDEVRNLGAYNRSLTGVQWHYENKRVRINAFASQDSSRPVIEELPAAGISGPYYINNLSILVNSEKVEIITRDRNQPSVVIKSVPQARFSDYEIEYLTGRIIFKAPVPSIDENLNPNYIRITYEVDQGGEDFWVYGVDGRVKILENMEVGGSYVKDDNPQDEYNLKSANIAYRLFDKTLLIGEWAETERESIGRGDGKRVELRHEGDKLQARAFASVTDEKFDNPAAVMGKGRTEAGANISYKLGPKTILRGEAVHTEDNVNNGTRDGVLVNVARSINKYVRAEAGMRYSKETTTPSQPYSAGTTPNEYTSARFKLGAQIPALPQLGVYGEYEQALDSDNKLARVGGEYQFLNKGRLYARHEFINSLAGEYALNSSQQRNATVFGIETDYIKDGHLFSEYRIRDSVSGREAEAAVGLRNQWSVAKGVKLHTGFESVRSLDKNNADSESWAVTGAVEYTAMPDWKGSARLEYRDSDTSGALLNTLGLAYKLNNNFTLLARHIISLTDNKSGGGDKLEGKVQVGFAYRPAETSVWNNLTKYEYKYERDDSAAADVRRDVNILSTHINYQPSRPLTLSGRYAGKIVNEDTDGIHSTSNTHLISARAIYDITDRWDAGLMASSLFSDFFKSNQYGAGVEVGYLVKANLWLSLGYNIFGFVDKDFSAEEYTNPGVYIRLRMKFDESLFSWKNSKVKKTLPDAKYKENPHLATFSKGGSDTPTPFKAECLIKKSEDKIASCPPPAKIEEASVVHPPEPAPAPVPEPAPAPEPTPVLVPAPEHAPVSVSAPAVEEKPEIGLRIPDSVHTQDQSKECQRACI